MKFAFLSSLIVAITLIGFVQQSDLSLVSIHPEQVVPGGNFDLVLNVSKKDIKNYSRIQLDLPKGFSAQLIDGKNGTFSFIDNQIKLIWFTLPMEDEFQVKIKVFSDATFAGSTEFKGVVTYLVGNERKEKKIKTNKIEFTQSAIVSDSQPSLNPAVKQESEVATGIKCTRKLTKSTFLPGEKSIVQVKVFKKNINGLGKLIETLPQGFTATEVQNNGAVFSFSNNQVKFLWMTLPAEDEFVVEYEIIADSDINEGSFFVEGLFTYLEGEDTKQYVISSDKVNLKIMPNQKVAAIVKSEPTPSVKSEPVKTVKPESPVSKTEVKKETTSSVKKETIPMAKNEVKNEVTPVKSTFAQVASKPKEESNTKASSTNQTEKMSKGVSYRVQICATKRPVNSDYFVKNHQFNEKIYLNMHEGWHKFTVGGFEVYEEARNRREEVKQNNKIPGPFVTAYNKAERITVQEALMITKQKWIP
jgi:hypothetical protein